MPGPRQEHFRMLALYNRWANTQLYQAAMQLPPERIKEDRGAFFKSVLGTLNHLVVADRIWMSRLEGMSPRGTRLDEVLYENMQELHAARRTEDRRIITYVFNLEEGKTSAPLSYQTTSGAPMTEPTHHILSHFFNHQTHHRGQAHDLICQIAGAAKTPAIDLLIYQRAVAKDDAP
ncbi:MAG: damage-inducible protein DinB [Rhodospirillaceae bacterium]|nr:MAG: damage-inducible protein DinB [Rhodospirillaceae bacterium]